MEHDSAVLDEGLPAELQAASADVIEQAPPSPRRTLLRGAGIVATGVVAGAIAVAALQSSSGASPAAVSGSTQQPAGQAGASGQGFRGGPPPGGGFGGPGGGVAGETRLSGTLSAVGVSSITVKAADGTSTTVPVNGTTEIINNGASASLSVLSSGEQVLVHVVPSGSGTVAERIFAGTGTGAGAPPPGPQGQTGATTSST